jgi:hypothetical protein
MFDGDAGQQQEQESAVDETVGQEIATEDDGIPVDQAQGEGAVNEFAMFNTPTLKVTPRPADAHRGEILGITSENFEKEDRVSTAIRIHLHSDDTQNDDEKMVFLPRFFVENVAGFVNGQLTIEDLPPGTPDPERPGKLKGNQRAHFGMSVSNSDGNADIQTLISIAAKSGVKPSQLGVVPVETFEDYVGNLNKICTGLKVVFTRAPQKDEENPQFNNRLKVNRVYFIGDIIDADTGATKPKILKRYVKQWELTQ